MCIHEDSWNLVWRRSLCIKSYRYCALQGSNYSMIVFVFDKKWSSKGLWHESRGSLNFPQVICTLSWVCIPMRKWLMSRFMLSVSGSIWWTVFSPTKILLQHVYSHQVCMNFLLSSGLELLPSRWNCFLLAIAPSYSLEGMDRKSHIWARCMNGSIGFFILLNSEAHD